MSNGKGYTGVDISVLACILMGLIYIFLPSSNNTLDSLGFAADVRDGENLFRNHHLLYNPLGYVLFKAFNLSNSLALLCMMNALFAFGCLMLLRSMLLRFADKQTTAVLVIFTGICFGFVRFATDAEAYIIPLFFALWGSHTMLFRRNIFVTSLLVAIACLFHQMYFFWWVGLYVLVFSYFIRDRVKDFFLYVSAALIVPAVYLIVFYTTDNNCSNIIEFIFHDYFKKEDVVISFKPSTLILTPISLIRTFIQVHGYFLPLIKKYFWLCIPIVLSMILFIKGCSYLKGSIGKKQISAFDNSFATSHLVIFVLQFLFAVFSDGNAEFMYMLPFAGVLYLFIKYRVKILPVFYFTLALFIWNFFLAVWPYHSIQLSSDKDMVKYMSENEKEVYYLRNSAFIRTITDYYYPSQTFQIFSAEKNVDLDSLVTANEYVVTNIIGNKNAVSRATFVFEKKEELENKYNIERVDSAAYDLGILNIMQLRKKTE